MRWCAAAPFGCGSVSAFLGRDQRERRQRQGSRRGRGGGEERCVKTVDLDSRVRFIKVIVENLDKSSGLKNVKETLGG